MKPLVVTPGEPSGIGPDILLQLIEQGCDIPLVAIASVSLLQARAKLLDLTVDVRPVTEKELGDLEVEHNVLPVLDVELSTHSQPGKLEVENASYVIRTLDFAIQLCQKGSASGLVTGPVHKGVINDGGLPFTGHTEYLKEHSGSDHVVMMLATEGLRVALVTTHLPLKDVSRSITQEKIIRVMRILDTSLREQFGCKEPNILVAGLNPHAGEGGHLGREEIETIQPALTALRAENIHSTGPLPADTLFQPHYLENADAVLAMYHDQGLPVLKYKGFGNAVNITLGLPFIRTSVDHGTALDLAGTGNADIGSLRVAMDTAWTMAKQRESYYA